MTNSFAQTNKARIDSLRAVNQARTDSVKAVNQLKKDSIAALRLQREQARKEATKRKKINRKIKKLKYSILKILRIH